MNKKIDTTYKRSLENSLPAQFMDFVETVAQSKNMSPSQLIELINCDKNCNISVYEANTFLRDAEFMSYGYDLSARYLNINQNTKNILEEYTKNNKKSEHIARLSELMSRYATLRALNGDDNNDPFLVLPCS